MRKEKRCKYCGETMITRPKQKNNKTTFFKICPKCGYSIKADVSEISNMESFDSKQKYNNIISNISFVRDIPNLNF